MTYIPPIGNFVQASHTHTLSISTPTDRANNQPTVPEFPADRVSALVVSASLRPANPYHVMKEPNERVTP